MVVEVVVVVGAVVAECLLSFAGSDNCDFMVRVVPTDLTAVHQYGAPPLFYIQYKSTNQTDSYVKGGKVDEPSSTLFPVS